MVNTYDAQEQLTTISHKLTENILFFILSKKNMCLWGVTTGASLPSKDRLAAKPFCTFLIPDLL